MSRDTSPGTVKPSNILTNLPLIIDVSFKTIPTDFRLYRVFNRCYKLVQGNTENRGDERKLTI